MRRETKTTNTLNPQKRKKISHEIFVLFHNNSFYIFVHCYDTIIGSWIARLLLFYDPTRRNGDSTRTELVRREKKENSETFFYCLLFSLPIYYQLIRLRENFGLSREFSPERHVLTCYPYKRDFVSTYEAHSLVFISHRRMIVQFEF